MSGKVSNNSVKLNCGDQPQWVKTPSLDTSVKLAGEEAKDRLYEPKHKKKLVRVLTVVAYVFFVSLAAIMLSLYYVFLWNGYAKEISKTSVHSPAVQLCRNYKEAIVKLPVESPLYQETISTMPTQLTNEDITESNTVSEDSSIDINETNKKKLLYKRYFYKNFIK